MEYPPPVQKRIAGAATSLYLVKEEQSMTKDEAQKLYEVLVKRIEREAHNLERYIPVKPR